MIRRLDIHRVKKIVSSAAAVYTRCIKNAFINSDGFVYDEVGELHYTLVVMTKWGGGVPVGKEIAGLIFPRPLGHHDHHVKCTLCTYPMN